MSNTALRRTLISTENAPRRSTQMNAINILRTLLIAALLSCACAHATDQTIAIALEEGKQVASFKVGDSSCVLKDDQIRCAPTRNK